jgi:hypothetical protein
MGPRRAHLLFDVLEFGAGEGIRTLDPNLGKMIRILSFTFAHLRSRTLNSYIHLTF